MAPTRNAAIIFNELLVDGYPDPNKTVVYDANRTIDLENVNLGGGVLVKILYLSNDPFMRPKLSKPLNTGKWADDVFKLGEPLSNFGIGRVVRSEDAKFEVGDNVFGFFNFEEYVVVPAARIQKIVNKAGIPLLAYLNGAGLIGKTAYYGYKEYVEERKGQTIWISTGAGAVGSILIQLCKLGGLKVIGSAGSDEKVALMKELGADVAFNYKTTNLDEFFAKEGPIDIYWDHVAGSSLDAALAHINNGGRVVGCGAISGVNHGHEYPYKNIVNIVKRTLDVSGFSVLLPKLAERWEDSFEREVPILIAEGKIKTLEDFTPFEKTGEALLKIQKGENKGKSIIVVAEE
ncbi:NAD-P-binding protein [Cylindrobasidium torrendii FP15055 ss-10]|uniref:NAD-P-binding protein n=1 Tax=Cylindrobasidium torrendii FP15055 ss-10 TaxID=1314674 RepID=A0A0D7ASY9_9AGAR|nr:NAD-P-binding protein [Cylindrobasidium torrendii FP15055 ss-10]